MYFEALEAISNMGREAIKIEGINEPETELNPNLSLVAAITSLEVAAKCANHTGLISNGTLLIWMDINRLPQGDYKHVSFLMPLSYIIFSSDLDK